MLKLLYIPTGNIFTMPDEEALKLRNSEPFNFRILDAGFQEATTDTVDKKDIKDLVMKADDRAEEIEKEDEAEVEAKKKFEIENKEYETELDFKKFTKADLVGALRRAGTKCNKDHFTKEQLIEMIIKAGIRP